MSHSDEIKLPGSGYEMEGLRSGLGRTMCEGLYSEMKNRRPYQDVEAIINIRAKYPAITQVQIGKILGMSKQAWSRKEICCKRWIEEGRPEQDSYENDYRLTEREMREINKLVGIYRISDDDDLRWSEWACAIRLLGDAVIADSILTEDLLRKIVDGTPDSRRMLRQIVASYVHPGMADHFADNKLAALLRGVAINGLEQGLRVTAADDANLADALKSAQNTAEFELKCMEYQAEFEAALGVSCGLQDIRKDGHLRMQVAELAREKSLPENVRDQIIPRTMHQLEEMIYQGIQHELQRAIHSFVGELGKFVENNRKNGIRFVGFEDSNIFG